MFIKKGRAGSGVREGQGYGLIFRADGQATGVNIEIVSGGAGPMVFFSTVLSAAGGRELLFG
jgi:hypothetical protein